MRRFVIASLALAAGACSPAFAGPPVGGDGVQNVYDHGVIVPSPVNRLDFLGAGVTGVRDPTDGGKYNFTFGGGGGGGGYSAIRINGGAALPAEPTLNWIVGLAYNCVDNAGATRTDCTLSQSPNGSSALVGTGRLLNTTAPLTGGGDHTADRTLALSFTAALNNNAGSLDVTAAAPTVTAKSENTAASAGAANSFIRTDAQIQVATAAPATSVTSDANASTQGSSNNLIRADARLVAATAAPSVSVVSDVSTFLQGVSSSLLRADARFTAATAAPSVNVLTDASTFSQGTSTSLLRADARFVGTTAAAVAITGNSSSQGTSTSFSRADHTHAITLANGSLTTGAGGMAVAYGFAANTALQGSDTLDQINAPVAPVSMGSQRLINLATCTSASDGCPKSYIDGLVQGLQTKPPVRVATTVALPANTYLFVACAGDTITVTALGVCPTIDGVTLALNDRVLVKNEGTSSHDGIYTVTTLGTALLSCVFTRASDMNASTEFPGAYALAIEGTTNSNTGWTLVADPDTTFTCGTTSQTWTQFSGLGDVTANAPLSKSGNALSLNFTAALNLNGSNLDVTAASPSVTVRSEATAASAGSANSFIRTDAQLQALTAAPTVNVLSDASTAQQGSLSSLLRSDARLLFTTAAPSTSVTTDANASTQGTATSGLRSDARLVLSTAAPTAASVQTDHAATAQGSAATSLRSDATLTMQTAAPASASVISDHGAVAQGVSNSGLRADATFTALTAAPSVTVKSEATAAGQGTSNSLLRADAQFQAQTAAPTVTVQSEATAAGQGASSSLLRADAQIQAFTATPTVNVLSDASTTQRGSLGSLLRSDARLVATTAAPTAASVISDHGVVAQGASASLLRADATFTALTAAPTTLDGTASNTQGTSNSLSRADHIHGMPATISIAQTWSASGTALTVTNTGSFGTINLANNASIPSAPSAPNLIVFNTPIAGKQLAGWRNADNYGFQGRRWGSEFITYMPIAGNAASIAGEAYGAGIITQGTTSHAALANTNLLTSQQHTTQTSVGVNNSFAEFCTGATACQTTQRGLFWRGNAANTGGFYLAFRFAFETNTAATSAFAGVRTAVGGATDPSTYTDEYGIGYRTGDATSGNFFFFRSNNGTAATAIDLGTNCARSITNAVTVVIYAPSNGAFMGLHVYNDSTQQQCAERTDTTTIPQTTVFLMFDLYQDTNGTTVQQIVDMLALESELGPAVN